MEFQIFVFIMGIVGAIMLLLLGIIAYFIRQSDTSNKETARQVTIISKIIAVSTDHFNGFEKSCNFKHEIIEEKIENHEKRIYKLEGK